MSDETSGRLVGVPGRIVIGVTLTLIGVISFGCLIWAWSVVEDTSAQDTRRVVDALGVKFKVSGEAALFLLVAAAAAVGSFVHAAESFVTFAGTRTLRRSWIPWYFLRTFIGIALATLLYLVVRAGFFANAAGASEVSPFGIAAIAGLSGLFSRQATTKLREVFDVIFKVPPEYSDARLKDKPQPAPIVIESLDPPAVVSGTAVRRIAVLGRGFRDGCVVLANDVRMPTTMESATRLTFEFDASQITGPAEIMVVVLGPDNSRTDAIQLEVTQPAP